MPKQVVWQSSAVGVGCLGCAPTGTRHASLSGGTALVLSVQVTCLESLAHEPAPLPRLLSYLLVNWFASFVIMLTFYYKRHKSWEGSAVSLVDWEQQSLTFH